MKFLVLVLLALNFSLVQANTDAAMDEYVEQTYQMLSQGMTDSEKKILREQMKSVKKTMKEYGNKSPEELEKIVSDFQKSPPPSDEEFKKALEKMSPEERAVYEKSLKNLKNMMGE
ncbi:MAG TPA: hypothetical protein VKY27_03290 [Bacteriovoracaceae bacterium]|nr:hypothetical protein [Bacteriovoracaceae bacterium]